MVTVKPAFGPFWHSMVAALNRSENFGVIALTDKSKLRQRCVLWGLGLEARMVACITLNLDRAVLTDPVAPCAAIAEVARE